MLLELTWLRNRKTLIISVIIDYIIFLLVNLTYTNYLFQNQIYIFYACSIYWLFLSYIFGRYHSAIRSLLKYSLYNFLKVFIILISMFSFLNIINFTFSQENTNFIFFLLFGSVTLSISQSILTFILKDRRKIIFICEMQEIDYLRKIESYKKKVLIDQFLDVSQIDDFDSKYFSKFSLVIFSTIIKSERIIELKKSGIKCQSLDKWCEENLFLIPIKFFEKNEFKSTDNLISQHMLNNRLKKFGDITISLVLLLITFPLVCLAAIFIKIEDNGSIIFTQKRTGFLSNTFKIYKLRTMSKKSKQVWVRISDPRITIIGKILRKTHLDELPQLINVIKGEMSLIGPRPEIPSIEEKFLKDIPNYYYRYSVRPGLSGWAQVNYKYGNSIEDTKIKLAYDFYYIKNYSIWLDIIILIKTLRQVLNAKGSIVKVT